MKDQNEISQRFRQDLLQARANRFMMSGTSAQRIEADYQKDPTLLSADLASWVYCALCAASVVGVELDLAQAVAAGEASFHADYSSQPSGS